MSKSLHPRWGRIIGLYSLSDIDESTLTVDSEVAGLRAMNEISRLAAKSQPLSRPWDQYPNVKISTLELALRLSQDPTKTHHLADPLVVSGCIRLMKTVIGETPGVASPFSYEFGYLCFRLLVVTLNACLLDRWGRLDEALTRSEQIPHAAAHVLISFEISSAVYKQFEIIVNGGDSDPVLGLSAPDSHHHRPQQSALLLPSEIETLLDILWDDRKLFLRALMLDVPIASGLSGLLFLFSRRVAQENDSQRNPSSLRKKLHELALRYYLVQDSSQIAPTLNVISSNPCYGDWITTAKHVDSEDSRWIMTAFIKRLSERSYPEPVIIEDASMMLRFVPLATDALTQDLLPTVLKHAIEYGWLVLLAQEDQDEFKQLVHSLLPSLIWLISPPHDRAYRLNPPTQIQVTDTIREGDLLDWMVFAMYKLDPTPAASEERSVQIMAGFFGALAKSVPASILKRAFQDYAPDWRKFYKHLKATGSSINIPCKKYYNTCLEAWYHIAQSLGLEQELYQYNITDCFNGRCPRAYTNDADAPRFVCFGCKTAVYCSERCQSIGWKFGNHRAGPPHREVCGPTALRLEP